MPPETLMAQYQAGDTAAAAALVDTLSPQFYRFFLAQFPQRARAEELLQNFWLHVHSCRRTYRPPEPVMPWMYAIARRVRIALSDQDRSHKQENKIKLPDSRPAEGDFAEFSSLMAQLPDDEREILVMLKVSGLGLDEVARATGRPVAAVKQQAYRAFEKLRETTGGADGA